MKCKCGNGEFYAHQVCYHDIIVDTEGAFLKDVAVSESDSPYGYYTCTKCGAEYDDLNPMRERWVGIPEANK